MARALILGGGMIGSTMAMDLAEDPSFDVTVADVRDEVLAALARDHGVKVLRADLSDVAELVALAEGFDVVLGALSSRMGLRTLRAMIAAGTPYVDVSFMADDPLSLREEALAAGVPFVVDCGVSPGLGSMLAGHATTVLDPCEELQILVGGVPLQRHWPYEYKAGFDPADVIEEYVRPARLREDGKTVTVPALSGVERVDFEGLGTLEAFYTDGLRTLLHTLDVPTMREKTMRYPGHAALMEVLRDSGYFSETPIDLGGQRVRPLDLTRALLFPRWSYGEGEVDLTVLRVEASGRRDGRLERLRWDMIDRLDPKTGLRSMSRTTAFPATLVARLVAQGRITEPGIVPPEILGQRPDVLDEVLAGLRVRGIDVRFERTHG
jgi:lysine 6-dehydrogenase